jgi:ribosomal protein S17E
MKSVSNWHPASWLVHSSYFPRLARSNLETNDEKVKELMTIDLKNLQSQP